VSQATQADVGRRALEELRRDGITLFRFDELLDEGLWSDVLADAEPFVRDSEQRAAALGAQPEGKEGVIFRRWFDRKADDVPEFSLDSPSLRVAASEELLGIVNTYQGAETQLYYVDNWFTPPYPEADARVASQRWHRDPEDEHVVKLFVYLSDVGDEAGPFEYVRSSTTGGRYGDLWRWGAAKDRWYPPTDELEAAVEPEDRLVMRGPAGSVVLADTGGFHRGGFAKSQARILCVATYLQPGLKGKYGDPRLRVTGDSADLSSAQRRALGL
jgi:hypothetical protein